jgi:hypothetical protein
MRNNLSHFVQNVVGLQFDQFRGGEHSVVLEAAGALDCCEPLEQRGRDFFATRVILKRASFWPTFYAVITDETSRSR